MFRTDGINVGEQGEPGGHCPSACGVQGGVNGILNAIRIYLSIKFRACWPFNCRIGHFWVPTWIPGFPASKRWLLEAAKQIRKLCTKHTYKTTFVQNTCDFTCPTFLHLK